VISKLKSFRFRRVPFAILAILIQIIGWLLDCVSR
jgi:hypothetical protein